MRTIAPWRTDLPVPQGLEAFFNRICQEPTLALLQFPDVPAAGLNVCFGGDRLMALFGHMAAVQDVYSGEARGG